MLSRQRENKFIFFKNDVKKKKDSSLFFISLSISFLLFTLIVGMDANNLIVKSSTAIYEDRESYIDLNIQHTFNMLENDSSPKVAIKNFEILSSLTKAVKFKDDNTKKALAKQSITYIKGKVVEQEGLFKKELQNRGVFDTTKLLFSDKSIHHNWKLLMLEKYGTLWWQSQQILTGKDNEMKTIQSTLLYEKELGKMKIQQSSSLDEMFQ